MNTIPIQQFYIPIPESNLPFFIIFETENQLMYFPFAGEISILSNILDFKLR
ncbi:hypothetical protein [Tissierella pigra]|uniref:hypothetical protein n=1 Tax=Tissierella pigra TaxID=2607614 RepID=UPI0018A6B771|nr:hypothetical protein [Tissierella pigra]